MSFGHMNNSDQMAGLFDSWKNEMKAMKYFLAYGESKKSNESTSHFITRIEGEIRNGTTRIQLAIKAKKAAEAKALAEKNKDSSGNLSKDYLKDQLDKYKSSITTAPTPTQIDNMYWLQDMIDGTVDSGSLLEQKEIVDEIMQSQNLSSDLISNPQIYAACGLGLLALFLVRKM